MDKNHNHELNRRLRSVEGHIRGVMRMVEEDRPCVSVIQQLQAIEGSLKQIQILLLQQYLDNCFCALESQSPDQVARTRQELLTLYDRCH